MNRPIPLQELVAATLREGMARTKLAEAAISEEEEKKKKEKEKKSGGEGEVQGALDDKSVPTEVVDKTASAMEYLVRNWDAVDWTKTANMVDPPAPPAQKAGLGLGATALAVAAANASGSAPSDLGRAKQQMAMEPGYDNSGFGADNTALDTDMDDPSGDGETLGDLQVKAASVRRVMNVIGRQRFFKTAEDAGASVSGGAAPPPMASGSAALEGKVPVPSAVARGESLIASSDAAINATKRDAKQADLATSQVPIKEQAQTSATDTVLAQALDHTGEAGAKIAQLKTDVYRTYFAKIAEQAASEDATPEDIEKARKLKEKLEEAARKRAEEGGDA